MPYEPIKIQIEEKPAVEEETGEYLSNFTRKENEDNLHKLLSIPNDKIHKHVQGLEKTENGNAKLYCDFQRAYLRLNSILRKNEDDIVQMVEGVPSIFEMTDGMSEHFCFKSDIDTNPRASVKIKIEKFYGKTEMYISDTTKKPTKQSALHVVEVSNKYIN